MTPCLSASKSMDVYEQYSFMVEFGYRHHYLPLASFYIPHVLSQKPWSPSRTRSCQVGLGTRAVDVCWSGFACIIKI